MIAAVVAVIAAGLAVAAAVGAALLLRREQGRTRTLEQELERGKAAFDEVVARELEERAAELDQRLRIARAESLSTLIDEERRITDERRRDVVERERDATARLADALTGAERRMEERLAGWSSDVEQLQEAIASELSRIHQRLGQVTGEVEAKIADESERADSAIDEQRELTRRLREDLARQAEEIAKAGTAELEQHAAERRRALQEVADRLRVRERELHEQVERALADGMQRIASQAGDVEHRQLEQLRRVVSREASRYSEAAAQQFDATFRSAREEAARRLGRELDLAIDRFVREAEGALAERIEHLTSLASQRVEMRLEEVNRRLDQLGDRVGTG
jgi:hypothetical protein